MRLRPTVKLITWDIITKVLPVYYIIMIINFILLDINDITSIDQAKWAIGGIVSFSFYGIFFLMLFLTPQSFRFLTQMGVSKRTQIKANAMSVIILSAVIALADRLLCLFVSLISFEKQFDPVIEFMASDSHVPFFVLFDFGLGFSLRILGISFALLMSMLLMRMNVLQKMLFCLGMFVVILIAWHDYSWFFFEDIAGTNPFLGMLILSFYGLIFFRFYIILARRQSVRD